MRNITFIIYSLLLNFSAFSIENLKQYDKVWVYSFELKQLMKQIPQQLQKTIKSFDKQIAMYQGWIKNPVSKVKNFNSLAPKHQSNLIHHWQQDILGHQELRNIATDVLKGL